MKRDIDSLGTQSATSIQDVYTYVSFNYKMTQTDTDTFHRNDMTGSIVNCVTMTILE